MKKDNIERVVQSFETSFKEVKKAEAEQLHNELLEVISSHGSDVYTILFVLEMLRFETMMEKYKNLLGG